MLFTPRVVPSTAPTEQIVLHIPVPPYLSSIISKMGYSYHLTSHLAHVLPFQLYARGNVSNWVVFEIPEVGYGCNRIIKNGVELNRFSD